MTADVHSLAGAYALDAIEAEEAAFFTRHLTACDDCKIAVREYRETATLLAAATSEKPPEGLRARVLALTDVTRQVQVSAGPHKAASRRSRLVPYLAPVAAGLTAAVVGLTGLAVSLGRQVDELDQRPFQTETVSVLTADDATTLSLETDGGAAARFVYSDQRDEGVLLVDGLAALSEDQVYELWLWRDGVPQPAGIFAPDSEGRAITAITVPVANAERIGVTIEPAGGVSAPTGALIAQAEL